MPIPGDIYKQIGRSAAGPVCIAAAYDQHNDQIVGLTVSSFVTLSFQPPMVMFALQHGADSYSSLVSSRAFGISILGDTQRSIASAFARKGRSKVEETTFSMGRTLRCPLIPEARAHIECQTSQIIMSGDHAIVVGLVEDAAFSPGKPLLYYDGRYGTFSAAADD